MARLLQHIVSPPEACHYLPGLSMTTESRVMVDVTPEELERLLERGWRRFGPVYFRPVCAGCQECVSLRVPVKSFQPSRNQRRVVQRAAHLRVEVSRPRLDESRLALHQRWHLARERDRDWQANPLSREEYALQFCFPHPSVREVSYWDGDRLVAVGIADVTPHAFSAVYCFYEPTLGELSLGTYNVLTSLALARDEGLDYVYLGYRVEGCASLRYKGRFQPQERLVGRFDPGSVEPRWEPMPRES